MNDEREKMIHDITESGILAQGKNELLRHLQGKRLTLKQAILANCYHCNGYFSDGRADCEDPLCPLYPWMAYNAAKDPSGHLTEEERQKRREGGKRLAEFVRKTQANKTNKAPRMNADDVSGVSGLQGGEL